MLNDHQNNKDVPAQEEISDKPPALSTDDNGRLTEVSFLLATLRGDENKDCY